MKQKLKYESPKMVFTKTELFENVAARCWAQPSLYCLVDPTDEDDCNRANYADLADFTATSNGCNAKMKDQVKQYLRDNYGTGAHHLTESDITIIMKSGGGNEGTSLQTSQYIIKVRS